MKGTTISQLFKFISVGVINTAIDLLVLDALLLMFGMGPFRYTAFKIIGFLAAVANSYYMNRTWVFRGQHSSRRMTVREGGIFVGISFVGLILNTAVSSIAYSALLATPYFSPLFDADAAALIGTAFVFVFNFVCYKFFVFNAPPVPV